MSCRRKTFVHAPLGSFRASWAYMGSMEVATLLDKPEAYRGRFLRRNCAKNLQGNVPDHRQTGRQVFYIGFGYMLHRLFHRLHSVRDRR